MSDRIIKFVRSCLEHPTVIKASAFCATASLSDQEIFRRTNNLITTIINGVVGSVVSQSLALCYPSQKQKGSRKPFPHSTTDARIDSANICECLSPIRFAFAATFVCLVCLPFTPNYVKVLLSWKKMHV